MKTVNQVSKLSGVSVRTLHHYDSIGLLRPSMVTESGYRLYGDAALERLQSILLLRELEFSLKEIKTILDTPGFDTVTALEQQIKLLELRRDRLDRLIDHARQIQKTGVIPLDFSPFDTTQMDSYAAEAKQKWGKTDAYKEFEHKTAGQSKNQIDSDGAALMDIFAKIGAVQHLGADSDEVQALVSSLQRFISEHYYNCTKPILSGLGQMYVADERFRQNIDRAGGEGTAEFVSHAIEIYCK